MKIKNLNTGEHIEAEPESKIKYISGKGFVEVTDGEKYWTVAGLILGVLTLLAFINVLYQVAQQS